MNLRRVSVVAAVLGALTLVGCASNGVVAASTSSPSPSSTAACAYSGTEKIDIPGCAMFDGEKSMQQNYAYKIRMTPTPNDQAILDNALVPAKAALLAITTTMPTTDQVKENLKAEGLTFVEVASDATTGIVFWAQKGMSGCLFGEIAPAARLKIEVGGFVADGGCHALTGH
jgi:hypothetical protein